MASVWLLACVLLKQVYSAFALVPCTYLYNCPYTLPSRGIPNLWRDATEPYGARSDQSYHVHMIGGTSLGPVSLRLHGTVHLTPLTIRRTMQISLYISSSPTECSKADRTSDASLRNSSAREWNIDFFKTLTTSGLVCVTLDEPYGEFSFELSLDYHDCSTNNDCGSNNWCDISAATWLDGVCTNGRCAAVERQKASYDPCQITTTTTTTTTATPETTTTSTTTTTTTGAPRTTTRRPVTTTTLPPQAITPPDAPSVHNQQSGGSNKQLVFVVVVVLCGCLAVSCVAWLCLHRRNRLVAGASLPQARPERSPSRGSVAYVPVDEDADIELIERSHRELDPEVDEEEPGRPCSRPVHGAAADDPEDLQVEGHMQRLCGAEEVEARQTSDAPSAPNLFASRHDAKHIMTEGEPDI